MIWGWIRRQLGFERPPRESYVRTSRPSTHKGWTVEPGVEMQDGDNFADMSYELYDLCVLADDPRETAVDVTELANRVAYLIERAWPGRAYFVEVHGYDGWVQIFQPFGIPRNR